VGTGVDEVSNKVHTMSYFCPVGTVMVPRKSS
jgi:hypothetical protein